MGKRLSVVEKTIRAIDAKIEGLKLARQELLDQQRTDAAEKIDAEVKANGTAPDKLLAEWFWTDRWIGSSGFLLPMESRGVYREMLTQAWRRGARLPSDHETIRRAIGATEAEWTRAWASVERFWREVEIRDGTGIVLVNDTQLEIYAEAKERSEKASHRGEAGARVRWGNRA